MITYNPSQIINNTKIINFIKNKYNIFLSIERDKKNILISILLLYIENLKL